MPQPRLSLPRLRLLALWLSQVAHFAGTYALRVFVALRITDAGFISSGSAWHLVTAVFMAPSILLVPLYGALANSLPKQRVLRAAAWSGLVIAACFTWLNDGWLACAAMVAITSASYTPTRLALLPAAARETAIPLNRVVGAIETGAVLAIVAGMIQGGTIGVRTYPGQPEMPMAMVVVSEWFLLCLAAASVVRFSGESRCRRSARAALQDFFLDALHLLRNPVSRGNLLAISYLRGVATASVGAFIAGSLDGVASSPLLLLLRTAFVTMAGAAFGSFLAALAGERRYLAAQVRIGAFGLTFGLIGVAMLHRPWWPLCFLSGACGGLLNVPLLAAFQRSLDPGTAGNAMALLNAAGYLAMTLTSALLAGLAQAKALTPTGQLYFVAGLAALGTTAAICYRGDVPPQLPPRPTSMSKSPE
jgi:hypothetical protein